MTEETHEKLKQVKQHFRLLMNGDTQRSMRNKGVDYHLNWGVSIPDLRKMADELGENYELAIELWKEKIRECKILATMTMPRESMADDLVELWMEQTTTAELAEQAVFNLYQHLPYAPMFAYKWIASERDIEQQSGYLLLARLFMNGQEPNDRGIQEFVDQALSALQGGSYNVRHAALNSMRRFAELGDSYDVIAQKALKSVGLALF